MPCTSRCAGSPTWRGRPCSSMAGRSCPWWAIAVWRCSGPCRPGGSRPTGRTGRLPCTSRWRQARAFPGATAAGRPLGIGMHTGVVGVGGLGEAQDTASALVGETALVAIALYEVAAAPGTTMCSPTTARLVQGVVQLDPGPSVPVGSPQTPMTVYTLRERSPRDPWQPEPGAHPARCFVGRRRELTTLRAARPGAHGPRTGRRHRRGTRHRQVTAAR